MITINKHINYLKYLIRHKWFVLKAGLKLNVPIYLLLLHDISKFGPNEWSGYVHNFFENNNFKKNKFKAALSHHYNNNKHHWQYWNNQTIPYKYICEMIADWIGVQNATNKKPAIQWYNENKNTMTIKNKKEIEKLLFKEGL